MNVPADLAEKYKSFFYGDEAGKFYLEQLMNTLDSNMNKAMNQNSLDYLSRAKGNREALDLIDNAIKNMEAKKPKE